MKDRTPQRPALKALAALPLLVAAGHAAARAGHDVDRIDARGEDVDEDLALGEVGAGERLGLGELEDLGRGTDEGDAVARALLGELGVLGEEAVARVDRVDVGLAGHPHDLLGVEVGTDRVALLADLVGLVGLEPVLAVAVLVREDGDRLRAQLGGGPEGPDGDLTTVGDEDLGYLTSHGSP